MTSIVGEFSGTLRKVKRPERSFRRPKVFLEDQRSGESHRDSKRDAKKLRFLVPGKGEDCRSLKDF
jgi:hypothetical protein